MKVVMFNIDKHQYEAVTLFESRDMDGAYIITLPEYGLIATEGGIPIAMGFLRCIEGSMAMLDSYITNKNASSHQRNRALDIITGKLINIAYQNNVLKLIAFSDEPNISDRASDYGFLSRSSTLYQFKHLT